MYVHILSIESDLNIPFSVVVQLAKAKGYGRIFMSPNLIRSKTIRLKVIASAGADSKVEYMRSLGADVAFNYKTTSIVEVLKEHGPLVNEFIFVPRWCAECTRIYIGIMSAARPSKPPSSIRVFTHVSS